MNARIKFIFVGCYAATFGLGIAAVVLGAVAESMDRGLGELVGMVVMAPAVLTLLGWFVSALWWIHDAWESVPEAYREVPVIGPVQPSTAVGLFFVPCFNVFWIFVCNIGLSESINRALAAQGSATRVPTWLAVLACCLHLVPYCNLLFGPLLWFGYMLMADKAREELGRVDAQAIANVF
ncbi:MAG: hypothetical protein M3Y87_11480 [Myxococcota bacterium]|nr:hypothetical protein [Myxococcota bacterium]